MISRAGARGASSIAHVFSRRFDGAFHAAMYAIGAIAERRDAHAGLAVSLAALVIASGWLAALPPAGSKGRETVTVLGVGCAAPA